MLSETVYLTVGHEGALPATIDVSPPGYSIHQRLRSGYHAVRYRLANGLRWSLGEYRELPAGHLLDLTMEQRSRVAVLQRRYGMKFEAHLSADTALRNYDYLDLLDQAWTDWGLARPSHGIVCDVGCANFWYARTLGTFFRPKRLIGVEVDGYRLYRNGHCRRDYARGYLHELPHAAFEVRNYVGVRQRADVITAWFPFITSGPLLAWRLPLSLFDPESLVRAILSNLNPNGVFVMVNHSRAEANIAAALCRMVGLSNVGSTYIKRSVRSRLVAPVISCWRRGTRRMSAGRDLRLLPSHSH
jgi:SAM-dependent methyltransferase